MLYLRGVLLLYLPKVAVQNIFKCTNQDQLTGASDEYRALSWMDHYFSSVRSQNLQLHIDSSRSFPYAGIRGL